MAKIGVDEWVAQAEERQATPTGPRGAVERWLRRVPFTVQVLVVAAAGATLPLWTSSDYTLRIGVNALLLVLLAVGLNTVVGWAGLLDLGYIAFYGFGAYTYALLSSEQISVHLATLPTILIVVVASALLGLLLGLPSRRLLGDYLAIVTLFFGQVFVELVLNLDRVTLPGDDDPISITGGTNGIPGVDAFEIFGWMLDTTQDYYLLLVGVVAIVALLLGLLNESRTGRAWRAVREDPLAAEAMSIPVNSMKLAAFAIGAAVAGLAGSIFAAVQIGVFPMNFETQVLILIYAAVILGGAGSVWGAVAGGLVIGISLELLRDPGQASFLFYMFAVITLLATVRPRERLALVAGATVALGLAAHAIANAIDSSLVAGSPHAEGWLDAMLDAWLILPDGDTRTVGNILFVVLVVGGIAVAQLSSRWRTFAIPVLLFVGAMVWEMRLVVEPSITRQLLLGALLVVLMNARPQGLIGQRRVEVL